MTRLGVGIPGVLVLCVAVVGIAAGGLAAEEPEEGPAHTIGWEECFECHESETEAFARTRMGQIFLRKPRNALEALGCENCHGPGSEHAEEEDADLLLDLGRDSKVPREVRNEVCLQCHEKGSRKFWTGGTHDKAALACVDCHEVMKPSHDGAQLAQSDEHGPLFRLRARTEICTSCHLDQKAELFRSSHMPVREGKMTCVDCHDPHGSLTEPLLADRSINENCTRCHAEKRGPFLWEHAPAVESCLNCHEAHGSLHDNLLIAKQPRLCQQCHIGNEHTTEPFSARSGFVFNRSCLNCHPQVHGSNHPSGAVLQR